MTHDNLLRGYLKSLAGDVVRIIVVNGGSWLTSRTASIANAEQPAPEHGSERTQRLVIEIGEDQAPSVGSGNPEKIRYGGEKLRPPQFAKYLIYLFLTKDWRTDFLGDLIEEYQEVRSEFSPLAADCWFYKQVGFSIWPLVRRAIIKIASIGGAMAVIRRLVS